MAGTSRRGGGDRVLESRHLIGLFLGVVLLCCVFFTLGYVMGKTQYGNSPVQAASLEKAMPQPVVPRSARATAQPKSSPEWDFYTDKKTTDIPLKPARRGEPARLGGPAPAPSRRTESASASAAPAASAPVRRQPALSASRLASETPARFRAPRISKNAIVLQVGALRSESDALAMAGVLQQRGFPAFVIAPTTDAFYRVQVGPFATQAVGDKAKQSLQREGFKAIYRR
ncbi:MAG: SPOR domain-containing protein [Candidatus Acidiferrales bacterium]